MYIAINTINTIATVNNEPGLQTQTKPQLLKETQQAARGCAKGAEDGKQRHLPHPPRGPHPRRFTPHLPTQKQRGKVRRLSRASPPRGHAGGEGADRPRGHQQNSQGHPHLTTETTLRPRVQLRTDRPGTLP
jgi:hypothetical protein